MMSRKNKGNTRVYNLISVPQMTRFLLGDAIMVARRRREANGKVRNNKTMLKSCHLFEFFNKQQNNIL